MHEQALQQVRADVAALLGQPVDGLEPKALYSLIQDSISTERQARARTHGGSNTLVLNGLLAAEMTLRTQVFGAPRPAIKADF